MKFPAWSRLIAVSLPTLLVLTGCGGGGKTIVTIDGDAISNDELDRYLEVKPRVSVRSTSGQAASFTVALPLGYQAMDDLIKMRILAHLAKEDGVYPSDKEVSDELEYQGKRIPNYLKMLTSQGLTVEQIKRDTLNSLIEMKLLSKGVTVSKDDVDQYIKDNPDQFREHESADLDWIVVSTDDKKKLVDSDLLSGQRFAAVAQRYSEAQDARSSQGRYPVRDVEQMRPTLQALVRATPELKATDWIKDGNNQIKFYIERKTPSKPIQITDVVREEVRRQIARTRGQAANDLDSRILKKMQNSKIDVKNASYKGLWDQEMEHLQQQVKANSVTPTPSQ